MTLVFFNIFACLGIFLRSGTGTNKYLGYYCDIVMSKLVTIESFDIFAGLAPSDISCGPTWCTLTSSCANS